MGELLQVVSRLDVEGQVEPEVVRDPVGVSVRICESPAAAVAVVSGRDGDRSAGGVVEIDRQGVAVGELVVADQLDLVRFVVGGVVPLASVDGLHPAVVHFPQESAGVGVRDPAGQFAGGFFGHQLHAVGLAVGLHQVVHQVLVHQQGRPGLVVQVMSHLLVVALQGEVHRAVGYGPVEAGRCLPAGLRTDPAVAELPGVHRRDRGGVGDQVDVLAHRVEAGLQGEVVPEGVLAGEAELGVDVEFPGIQGQQAADTDAALEGEPGVDGPVVTEEQGGFHGLLKLERTRLDEGRLRVQAGQAARREPVPGGIETEREVVRVLGVVAEGGFEIGLADAALDPEAGHLVEVVVEVGVVLIVTGRGHEVEPGAQAAAPFQRSVEVGVAEGGVPVEGEAVPGPVAEGLDGVVVVDFVGQRGVEVAERGPSAVVVAALGQQVEDPVGIGGPATHDKGGAALGERPLEVEAAGQQAETQRPGEFVAVALAGPHVQHRGDASAEFCGDGTFVEFHLVDDVGVEGGEDAEKMGGIVDGAFVEKDQVLVGGAAADVEAAGGFAHGFHARQGEHGLDDVALAEGGGDLVDDLHPHPLQADLGVAVAGDGVGGDHGAVQGGDLLLHHDVQRPVVPDLQGEVHVIEGITAEIQTVVPDGQGEPVEAVGIGDGVGAGLVVIDGYAGQGFAAGDVADVTADEDLAAAARVGFADLIDLVLEGGHGALLSEPLAQAAVVGESGTAVVEIAGGQFGEHGLTVEDEAGAFVAADDVAFLAQLRECGFEEFRTRGADGESGLLGLVHDEVDVRPYLLAQEADQRIQLDALDFEEILGAGVEHAQPQGGEKDQEKSFHRAASLRMARQ